MGALMRDFAWEESPLRSPHTWPQSLRVTIRLMLNTNHPMFIWWGSELIHLAKEALRDSTTRLERLFDQAPSFIAVLRGAGHVFEFANAAYRGYVLGCRLIVPGIMNKLLAIALKIIPHALLLPIVGWLLRPDELQPSRGPFDKKE